MTQKILHIDASARRNGSSTRQLTEEIIDKLGGTVIRRDLADGLPLINEAWVGANFTPEDQRDPVQRDALALSDSLVDEVAQADVLVIGAPIYNFGIPAVLKAWIDMIARARLTFRYTENGPQGLMTGKRAIIAVASGGTKLGSEIDFASDYLRHILGFIGISDVEFIAADDQGARGEDALTAAREQIKTIAA